MFRLLFHQFFFFFSTFTYFFFNNKTPYIYFLYPIWPRERIHFLKKPTPSLLLLLYLRSGIKKWNKRIVFCFFLNISTAPEETDVTQKTKKRIELRLFPYDPRRCVTYLQRSSGSRFKNFSYTLLAFCGTFKVCKGVNFFSHCTTFLGFNRFLFHFTKFLDSAGIIAKILFVAYQYYWHVWAKVFHLRCPFFRNVLQRVWTVDWETHQYNVSVGIRQRTKSVVVLLTSRIPQG